MSNFLINVEEFNPVCNIAYNYKKREMLGQQ